MRVRFSVLFPAVFPPPHHPISVSNIRVTGDGDDGGENLDDLSESIGLSLVGPKYLILPLNQTSLLTISHHLLTRLIW